LFLSFHLNILLNVHRYLLGGMVLLHKNTADDSAMKYFESGLGQLECMCTQDR